jgi:transcriptional/translational regulatory protein YebC/TACO1
VTTAPNDLHAVKQALEKVGMVATEAELSWIPKNTVKVEGAAAESLVKLIEAIEDLDDVQKVDANFDMDVSELQAG